jgi:hypothetical protein
MNSSDKGLVYFILAVAVLAAVIGVTAVIYNAIDQSLQDWTFDCGTENVVGHSVSLQCSDHDGNIYSVTAELLQAAEDK